MSSPDLNGDTRARQLRVLLQLVDRLQRGDPPLPTDVMAQIIDELEQRIDADAVAESWELEGRDIPPLQWDPEGDARVPGIRSVAISRRAARDLVALERVERDAVMNAIDALAHDASPRGAVALHGRARGHVQHRVGRARLLYCIRAETVLVVAVTSGPA